MQVVSSDTLVVLSCAGAEGDDVDNPEVQVADPVMPSTLLVEETAVPEGRSLGPVGPPKVVEFQVGNGADPVPDPELLTIDPGVVTAEAESAVVL